MVALKYISTRDPSCNDGSSKQSEGPPASSVGRRTLCEGDATFSKEMSVDAAVEMLTPFSRTICGVIFEAVELDVESIVRGGREYALVDRTGS